MTYDWPGNVRELRNAVRRAVLLSTDVIDKQHICQPSTARARSPEGVPSVSVDLGQKGYSLSEIISKVTVALEKDVIQHVLHETQGNQSAAAKRLKIGYKTLQRKLQAYGLRPSRHKPGVPVE